MAEKKSKGRAGREQRFSRITRNIRAAILILLDREKAALELLGAPPPTEAEDRWRYHMLRANAFGLASKLTEAEDELRSAEVIEEKGGEFLGAASLGRAEINLIRGDIKAVFVELDKHRRAHEQSCHNVKQAGTIFRCAMNASHESLLRALAFQWTDQPEDSHMCMVRMAADRAPLRDLNQAQMVPQFARYLIEDAWQTDGCSVVTSLAAAGGDIAARFGDSNDAAHAEGADRNRLQTLLEPLPRTATPADARDACRLVLGAVVEDTGGDLEAGFAAAIARADAAKLPLLRVQLRLLHATWLARTPQPGDILGTLTIFARMKHAASEVRKNLSALKQVLGPKSPVVKDWEMTADDWLHMKEIVDEKRALGVRRSLKMPNSASCFARLLGAIDDKGTTTEPTNTSDNKK
jgi:hypothetical protein